MKIESISIEGYGPFYGEHTFSFSDRGLTLVMGDNQDEPRMNSNGAGKSSIFDALDWCLFGKVPRDDKADSVRNEESKLCRVHTFVTADDGKAGQVIREREKSGSLKFILDGSDCSALDMKETQRMVEDFLGLDRDVFHAAVLFGQTDLVTYAESTDVERMKILTKILQLDEIDVYLDQVKEKRKAGEQVRAQDEAKAHSMRELVDQLERTDFSGKISEWEMNRNQEVLGLHASLQACSERLDGLQKSFVPVGNLQAQWEEIERVLAGMVPPDRTALDHVYSIEQEAAKKMSVVDSHVAMMQRSIYDAQSKQAGECPECYQVVTGEHLQGVLAKLIAKKNEVDLKAQEAHTVFDQCRATRESHEAGLRMREAEFQTLRSGKIAEVNLLKREASAASGVQQQITSAETELVRVQAMVDRKVVEANPYVEQETQHRDRLDRRRVELKEVEARLGAAQGETAYLDFWVEAFGPKGLKSYILDSRLQELTDAANQWVRLLTGGTIWVQFEAVKQTQSKKIINSPDVRVCRWNPDGTITERNFRSWSGGEKQRISFAIDFGLSRLIASRAKQSYDLLILDEVFRHLDQAGKEAVMDMLITLSKEKSSMFVVEHDTEFQAAFEHRIVVRKENKRSSIVEVDNGQENEVPAEDTSGEDLSFSPPETQRPRRTPIKR